jgi:hypothetical protein
MKILNRACNEMKWSKSNNGIARAEMPMELQYRKLNNFLEQLLEN